MQTIDKSTAAYQAWQRHVMTAEILLRAALNIYRLQFPGRTKHLKLLKSQVTEHLKSARHVRIALLQ